MFVRTMIRSTMLVALLVTVSACANKKDAQGDIAIESRDSSTLDTTVYDQNVGGPVPGSQQDLVVNVGDRVFFGYDQFDLTPEGQRTLEMQADWMKLYPNVNVNIEGHCDERGTREYNLALGDKRANSAKNYLIALGVPADRIQTISYGKERPAVMGSNPSAWAQNRRGVTVVN
ncbi:MAG: peptidoglycan-associated lipoprotein Pal [Alphaproteobacteria bacterium]|nr:peptidoglycan-associated lipoprotein Pal [Alphaproteobacteria bacterium]